MKLKLGHKLLSIRDERRLSQNEMAELLNLSPSAYARIERNETSVEYDKLTTYAEVLGIPVNELLPDTIAITSKIDNSGYGGGVIFGNQYFYTSETDRVKELLSQISTLQAEVKKLKGE